MGAGKGKAYRGGTFRDQLLQYSKDRAKQDPKYRKELNRVLAERRRSRQTQDGKDETAT